MTGVAASSGSARSCCSMANPSITGICMSLMTRSGLCVRIKSSPCTPLSADKTVYPSFFNTEVTSMRVAASSSMTTIKGIFIPVCTSTQAYTT